MNKKTKGLKKLRNNQTDKKPKFKCENCNCFRYSSCTCKKKGNS